MRPQRPQLLITRMLLQSLSNLPVHLACSPQITVRVFVLSPGANAATPTEGNPKYAGAMSWLQVRAPVTFLLDDFPCFAGANKSHSSCQGFWCRSAALVRPAACVRCCR